jgi:hypothetical protein
MRFTFTLAVAGALLVTAAPASATITDPFGARVSTCAQTVLGTSMSNPPNVECMCGNMTFRNFGAMVEHMREMGCGMGM